MQADYVSHMGTDSTVADAARVSFADEASQFSQEQNNKLIHWLAKHNHWTPFAHPQITLRMRAPVPIRTQCFKHKQGFVENEESRRYISSAPTFIFPEEWRRKPEGSIKQGSGEVHKDNEVIDIAYRKHIGASKDLYLTLIGMGVCPEQARFVLPQGVEVNWYWTGSLAAFARFYKQRTDSHAQVEIQELAIEVGNIIEPLYTESWAALTSNETTEGE